MPSEVFFSNGGFDDRGLRVESVFSQMYAGRYRGFADGHRFCPQDAPQSRQSLNPLRIQQKISDIQMLDPVSAEIYFVQ